MPNVTAQEIIDIAKSLGITIASNAYCIRNDEPLLSRDAVAILADMTEGTYRTLNTLNNYELVKLAKTKLPTSRHKNTYGDGDVNIEDDDMLSDELDKFDGIIIDPYKKYGTKSLVIFEGQHGNE